MESTNSQSIVSLLKSHLNGASEIIKAYIPIVNPMKDPNEDGNFDKFGGMPAIPRISLDEYNETDHNFDEEQFLESLSDYCDELWPICEHCKIPKTFFFQLTDPKTLTTYQMFMCVKCNNESTACVREIKYDECYSINEIITGLFKESVFINGLLTQKNYPFTRSFINQCHKAHICAYDHKITDEDYYRQHLRDHDKMRDHKSFEVFYRSYRVSEWQPIEESLVSVGEFLDLIYKSPLAEKLPPWICLHDDKSNKNWYRYQFEDYVEKKDAITHKLKGYDCWCFCQSNLNHGIKFHGKQMSCQGCDYSNSIFQFGDTYYLPYMWGDSGYAHILKDEHGSLIIKYDCC
jgi:hypothetical protein